LESSPWCYALIAVSSASQAVEKKLVFVVDDDPAIRGLLVQALRAKGYDVQEAADGLAASEMLGRMPRVPDLLICDVMMPKFDGFSLARMLRSHTELRGMRLIFLTAKGHPGDVTNGIRLGATHYVQKPFSIVDLLDKVARTLVHRF
jgi:DNA-binding response OmpR family regulator